tara:strand:+ start:1838 stop:2905 length:1068 start_codon:yes stop_codon:yes gene_type:complete
MGFKKYAYYNHGNKVAIVEKETNSTSANKAVAHCTIGGYDTKATCEAAGGQWIPSSSGIGGSSDQKYLSPKESVDDGIEIEYTYSPIYNMQGAGVEGTDYHRFIGWGSDGANLLLFTYGASAQSDLSSLFAADDYIVISGSDRWDGLHQVKSAGASTGILTLKTSCNIKPATIASQSGNFVATNNTYLASGADHTMNLETFKDLQSKYSTAYVFITAAADVPNNGFFSLSSDSTSGQISFVDKFTIDADGDYTTTAAAISAEEADTINIFNAFYGPMVVREGIEVMQDEDFDLDLTSYQSKAIVYYVKAKMSEEGRDMEGREYFMRLFKKQLEKERSARKRGPYIAMGNSNMRSY